MRELELDGIHDDGDHIVLRDLDGEQYTLRIDEALRAAVRRDRPALGLIQSTEATALRPREIQGMLRAGHTAEDISKMASIDVEHVRRYEGPVLAERGFTAERARTFKVDRSGGPVLDSIVTERLAARQALDGLRWDAWRLPDGTWNLELVFRSGGREREAHWIADMTRQIVVAEDDEARWLSLDDDALDQPVTGRARLTSLKSAVYDQESDADGASARPRRSSPRSLQRPGQSSSAPRDGSRDSTGAEGASTSSAAAGDGFGEEDLDALNARRGLRPVPSSLDEEPTWSSLDEDAERSARAADRTADPDADQDALREHADDDGPSRDPLPEAFDEDDVDGGSAASTDDDLEVTGGPEGDGEPEPLVVPGRTLEESVATGDGTDEDGTTGTSDGPRAVGSDDAPTAANDTVDLTPLPGFDDVPSTSSEDSSRPRDTKKGSGKGDEKSAEKKGKASARAKRSSIPSWDEIVFGSKHD